MKKVILYVVISAILSITQYGILFCQAFSPTLTTTSASNITATTVSSGGNISSDGGGSIVARGVCWSTYENPTIADKKTSDGTGIGLFISNITGLLPSTIYHLRAYATNCAGTAYGNDITFTTYNGLPVVITTPITAITQVSVTVGGNVITYDAPSKGIVYGPSPEPQVGVGETQIAPGGSGNGSYECNIGLSPNTLYYLRAYAMNSFGYSYGEQLTVILPINQAGGTVHDNDGNTYNTVKIGNQAWFTENLKTTRYNTGDPITQNGLPVNVDNDWNTIQPAYCWYGNDVNNKTPYGALYNWYAVNGGELCPTGWHVPSDDEWSSLTTYLLGVEVAGGKLKESGTDHWASPNTGATNEAGFLALPGGHRVNNGEFSNIGLAGYWWSVSENGATEAFGRGMAYDIRFVDRFWGLKTAGNSVRCVNNQPSATINGGITVCQNSANPSITFTGADGTGPYTFTYKVNGGNNQTVTTVSGNSVSVSVPTNIVGTFRYSLVSVEDAYSHITLSGYATIEISPIPTATIAGSAEVCMNSEHPSVTLTGNYGIPEYTFSYSVNGSEPIDISSSCTSAVIDIATETAGVQNYNLLTVTDSRGCASSFTDQHVVVTIAGAAISTVAATAVTSNTATLNGNVNANGINTNVRFDYGINTDYGNNIPATPGILNGTEVTSVAANITSLNPNSTYHYRIVSETNGCTVYGNDISFTTPELSPLVVTGEVTYIRPLYAQCSATFTSQGGPDITEKGVCWSTEQNPTTSDFKTISTFGSGPSFPYNLSVLTPLTTYYVRAYAVNGAITTYGNQVSFTTTQTIDPIEFNNSISYGTITDIDGNTYRTLRIGNQVWMAENLKTTKYNNGSPITNVTDDEDWMNIVSPAFCWINNDPFLSKDLFGALYNWYVVGNGNLCPDGWYVPNDADWAILVETIGGELEAGGKLKETGLFHWAPPNIGADNSTGFTALPGGSRQFTGAFNFVGNQGYWWSSTENGLSAGMQHLGYHFTGNPQGSYVHKGVGASVRCIMSSSLVVTTAPVTEITRNSAKSGGTVINSGASPVTAQGVCWNASPGPTVSNSHTNDDIGSDNFISQITGLAPGVTYYVRAYATNSSGTTTYGEELTFTTYRADAIADIEGNFYNVIEIGNQIWMQENLKTTQYNNGDEIPLVTDNTAWTNLSTPGYCFYNNDSETFMDTYGALYNWYATDTESNGGKNVCPTGWQVPTKSDWTILYEYLIANGYNYDGTVAGNKIAKSLASTTNWEYSSVTGSVGNTDYPEIRNNTGFSGQPAGCRSIMYNSFWELGRVAIFWTPSENDALNATAIGLYNNAEWIAISDNNNKKDGFSVRCIKDPLIVTNTDDSGCGSLRNAIEYANSNPGNDIISFDIPGEGPFPIQLLTPLPIISESVIIDGYTQPGTLKAGEETPAYLLIELDGINLPESTGLYITASNCVIRGLMINRFGIDGIQLVYGGGNVVEGNYIGVDAYGNAKVNLSGALRISESPDNLIGGDLPENRNVMAAGANGGSDLIFMLLPGTNNNIVKGNYLGISPDGETEIGGSQVGIRLNEGAHHNTIGPRNIISGNSYSGIQMDPIDPNNSHDNQIIGNYIGTNHLGTVAIPNGAGIRIYGAINNRIGGSNPADRNIISGNSEYGIEINSAGAFPASGNVIQGNYIGLSSDGSSALGNGSTGISINSQDNTIGGEELINGNVISGNGGFGILLSGPSAAHNKIIGNLIGTNNIGTSLVSNKDDGINITGAPNNNISGNLLCGAGIGGVGNNGIEILDNTATGNKITENYIGINALNTEGLGNGFNGIQIKRDAHDNIIGPNNIISGNLAEGILIESDTDWGTSSANNNIIAGNLIGTTADGKNPFGNNSGIVIKDKASKNVIGHGNIISGNLQYGIRIDGNGTESNLVVGNYIGTDISGSLPLENSIGVGIFNGASNNTIGGSDSEERNIISANNLRGIHVGSSSNKIIGNYIGADVSGKLSLGNIAEGIMINDGSENTIGGLNINEGNLISGNGGAGIYIYNIGSTNNKVFGNILGTDYTGVTSISNNRGVVICGGARGNQIGDTIKGGANLIAYSASDGVLIFFEGTANNRVSGNSIHSNGGLGINLGNDNQVNPNDEVEGQYDIDTGPNNLQNYPEIDSLNYTSNSVYIKGHLKSAASSQYSVQFFANKVADNAGYGEGRTYLGSDIVTTSTTGLATFAKTFSRSSGWGDVITATATDADGNTSEFSMALGGLSDQIIASADWPVHFKVNEEGIPRISDGSDITAVRESFKTWENITTANIDFVDDGTTTQRFASANDGVNLVSFTDEQFPFPKGVLAMAAKTLKVSPIDDVAYIIDADIVVNPEFVLHDVGVGYGGTNEGYYDAQSIITHEIGHILGLLHTGVVNSTMFFMLDQGTTVRSLEQDDRSWASYKYPGATYTTTLGSISGNIYYGDDESHPAVAGALVLAINTETRDTVHAYSDADGNYIVPGLPPGIYNVYIQPLDGDVYGYTLRPGNISTYVYCNTIYTDYPAEYLSEGDSEDEPVNEVPLPINVTLGSPNSVSDIVTNKDLTPPEFVSVRPTNVVDKNVPDENVNVMSDFLITFSEPVDVSTFTDLTCYIDLDGVKLGGSWIPLADTLYKIYFNPGSALGFGTTYTLYLTDGIKDMKGNPLHLTSEPDPITYTFTTVAPDAIAPAITSTSPVNGAESVFVTAKVKVLFSESMNTGSVNDNFALTWEEEDPAVTREVDGAISWDNEKRNLTFTPYTSLREDEEYTISISAGAADLSGNRMYPDATSVFESVFETVQDAAPEVLYLGPENNQGNVTIETPIVADFTEPIDPSSVTTSTFSLEATESQTAVTGTFDFLNANSRVVFRPETNLEPNTGYTILITTGISDVSDIVRKMENDKSSVFTTAATAEAPEIIYLDPANGKAGSVVTIAGSGFAPETDNNTISFNGITAYARTASLNTLTTEVPMGTLSGPVTVTVNSRFSNQMQFTIISDYENDPTGYVVTNKSLGSGSTGGSDIGGDGEAVYALVTNPEGNLVNRIELGNSTGEIQPINVGLYPLKVDIDPQGKRAYVTNFASHDVSVIDLGTNSVVSTIPVGENPFGVVVTPDGKRVYVSNTGSADLSLVDVDPSSGGFDHVVANVPIGSNSGDITVTGDAGTVNVRTGSNSGDITVTADAGMVLVTGDFGLFIVDSDTESDDYNSVIANVSSGTRTNDVTVTADAGYAIVSTVDGSLLVISLHPENDDYSGAVIANVPTGTKVTDVQASADAVYVYATDTENNQILVYKFGLGGTGASGGSGASGMTLIPLDPIKYDIYNVPVGYAPIGLVVSPAGDKIYTVTGAGERSVTTISLYGLEISPENSIESLISAVQTLMNYNIIKSGVGNELVRHLTTALNYVAAGDNKNAINSLNTFIVKVNDLIKSKQITSTIGQPLIDAARVIVIQLGGKPKSGAEESAFTDTELPSAQDIISKTKLGSIYPNPSREAVTIDYEIASDELNGGRVSIQVFDITGRVVGNLVNGTRDPGRYSVSWNGYYENGSPAPRGIYYIRFTAGNIKEVQRIMLVR